MEKPLGGREKFMKQAYAQIVHDALKESGINFVAYLPDDQIHDAQKLITEDPNIITVGATNEAEAVSACAGAWLGGAKPALLIADSGFLVATWPLASCSWKLLRPTRSMSSKYSPKPIRPKMSPATAVHSSSFHGFFSRPFSLRFDTARGILPTGCPRVRAKRLENR